MASQGSVDPRTKRYPYELKVRAVRLVHEEIAERGGDRHGVVASVSRQLGINDAALGKWLRRAEIDARLGEDLTNAERQRLDELEQENRELRRANEILKAAASFFGAELDRRSPR
jgi:transposase